MLLCSLFPPQVQRLLAGRYACSGAGPCVVSMTSDKEVTARFTQQYDLTVAKGGTGRKTVISSPGGINCGSDLSEAYDQGTSVTLWPVPDIPTGSAFTGWSRGRVQALVIVQYP